MACGRKVSIDQNPKYMNKTRTNKRCERGKVEVKWLPIVDTESIMQLGRAWCPWRGQTHDAKPEAQTTRKHCQRDEH